MQTIINIQISTSLRLLRKAKCLLATQGICHYTGQMNAPVEQLTSSVKKYQKKTVHRPSFGYPFFSR